MCAASEASHITHSSSSRCSKIGTYLFPSHGAPTTTLWHDEDEVDEARFYCGCLAKFSLCVLCRACRKCRGGTWRAPSLSLSPSRRAHRQPANMFSLYRNSTQRPNDGMLAQFKQTFPSGSSQAAAVESAVAADHGLLHVNASQAGDAHLQPTRYHELLPPMHPLSNPYDSDQPIQHNFMKDISELTPLRFSSDQQWRLTPGLFDQNAFNMQSMGNNSMGYAFPTPGGMNTVYQHPVAGDLHTPGLSFQLGTPLSMPIPDNPLNAGPAFDQSFNPQLFHHHNFDPNHLYPQQVQQQHQQQAFPPSLLLHKDSGFGASSGSPGDALGPVGGSQVPELDHKNQLGPSITPVPLDQ